MADSKEIIRSMVEATTEKTRTEQINSARMVIENVLTPALEPEKQELIENVYNFDKLIIFIKNH